MRLNILGKLSTRDRLAALSESHHRDGKRIVLCHGCFDILHPGHLRYLQFARKQGDVLFVSLTSDSAIEKSDGTRPFVPQELRAESLAALEFVDHVVLSDAPTACEIIELLRPDLYIKGKDCENSREPGFLLERERVEQAGGKVIFSSGEVVFSSTTLLDRLGTDLGGEQYGSGSPFWFSLCCQRWGITLGRLRSLLEKPPGPVRVAVVGDASLDRYFNCDAGQMSAEAPVLTVKPVEQVDYPAGVAGIASHLASLGAEVTALYPVAPDRESRLVLGELDRLGVTSHTWKTRRAFPVRERYLTGHQKLLQVDRVEVQPLVSPVEDQVLDTLLQLAPGLDAVIFCDLGSGALHASSMARLAGRLRSRVPVLTGCITGPRKSVFSMEGFSLVVPTERDLRSALGDFELDLPSLAIRLIEQLGLGSLAVHLDQKGCVLFQPRRLDEKERAHSRPLSEFLPGLARGVVDATGSLEAFVAASTLALARGEDANLAAYLGAATSAHSMEQPGNLPVNLRELVGWLERRPELVDNQRQPIRFA